MFVLVFLTIVVVIISTTAADTLVFNYANQGNDWHTIRLADGQVNECDRKDYLSPINLLSPVGPSGWIYGRPIPFAAEGHSRDFKNPEALTQLAWDDLGLNLGLSVESES